MPADDVAVLVVDVKAVARGYRMTSLIGRDVFNDRDESVGVVDDFIMTRETPDRISFAVLEVGGFLGIGAKLVAIPFDSLQFDQSGDKLRIVLPGATRDTLEKLPEFVYRSI